ncbi:DUF2283 domain-containing protein [Candidatus Pacearchaeota archaeon]|jgi:uncharacterized protein YuzE|nr:DUF2283 domain-containing protein [Candidatus Pacearchaeota archaeon]|tara:strand:- start:223 stop:432 length:210 start_codon:yes stop_codon:yes gene_type:complete
MKIKLDKDADAAYIKIVDKIKDGEATKNIMLSENIILDFNSEGNLLGIEVLDASKTLNQDLLLEANSIN